MSEVQVIRNHSKFYVLPLLLALEPDYKNFNYNQISNTFLFQYKEDLDKYLETEELKYIINIYLKHREVPHVHIFTPIYTLFKTL